jgi:hypothetical protein
MGKYHEMLRSLCDEDGSGDHNSEGSAKHGYQCRARQRIQRQDNTGQETAILQASASTPSPFSWVYSGNVGQEI